MKQFGLEAAGTADLYVPLRQMPDNQAPFVAARVYWVVQTTDEPLAIADGVRRAVRVIDKDVAASSTRTLDQIVESSVGARRFITDLLRITGVAGVVLALVGVYAITAFAVGRRTREIGIRLTLGGTRWQVVRPLLRAELRSIAVGLAIGACGAAGVARILSSVLFAAGGVDSLVIPVVGAGLAAASIAACVVPAWRALTIDPAVALRQS